MAPTDALPERADNVLLQMFRTGHAVRELMAHVVAGTGVSSDEWASRSSTPRRESSSRWCRSAVLPRGSGTPATGRCSFRTPARTPSRASTDTNEVIQMIRVGGGPVVFRRAFGDLWLTHFRGTLWRLRVG